MANSPSFDFRDPDARGYCAQCGAAFARAEGNCQTCDRPVISREAAIELLAANETERVVERQRAAADAPIVVHTAHDQVEAQGIAAHLEAAGIPFATRTPGGFDPYRMVPQVEFLVAPADREAAATLLAEISALADGAWELEFDDSVEPESLPEDDETGPTQPA